MDDAHRRPPSHQPAAAVACTEVPAVNRGSSLAGEAIRDARHALRVLRKTPGHTFAVVLILALGIGASGTVFAWVRGTLLTPIPGAGDLRGVVAVVRGEDRAAISYPDFLVLREETTSFAALAAYQDTWAAITEAEVPDRVYVTMASANYFETLSATPTLGRAFRPEEELAPGPGTVAVISDALWRRRYAGARDVVGRTIELNGRPYTIVGVAPRGFLGGKTGLRTDVWVPLAAANHITGGEHFRDRTEAWYNLVGRLRPGTTRAHAQLELRAWQERRDRAFGATPTADMAITVHPLWSSPVGANGFLAGVLPPLLGAAATVLLLACVNVTNLLLVRSVTRRREFSIRLSLGAGPMRVRRQLLVESAVLAAAAFAVAVLLMLWSVRSFHRLLPVIDLPLAIEPHLTAGVLLATAGLAVAAGLATALLPASRAAGLSPVTIVNGETGRSAGSVFSSRLIAAFVIAQVALSVVLTITAGLFGRSALNATRTRIGFDADGVMLATVDALPSGYTTPESLELFRTILEELETIPTVESVTLADWVPLSFQRHMSSIEPEGYPLQAGERIDVHRADVGPDYFRTLRIPLLEGRDLRITDDAESMPVAVVDRTFRDKFWPGQEVLGKRVRAHGRSFTVVGVAENSRHDTYDEVPAPFLYLPQLQHFYHAATFHVRATGRPADAAAAVRVAIHRVDPKLPIHQVLPLREQTRAAAAFVRIAATLAGIFGGIALLLAALGVYAVIAQATKQRTREIGIRLALGADPGAVLRLLLRRGVGLGTVGLALGTILALIATRTVQNQLVGVGWLDPLTWSITLAGLAGVSLLASYLPVRKAARQDAVMALRAE